MHNRILDCFSVGQDPNDVVESTRTRMVLTTTDLHTPKFFTIHIQPPVIIEPGQTNLTLETRSLYKLGLL
jgi:hypothetical protein